MAEINEEKLLTIQEKRKKEQEKEDKMRQAYADFVIENYPDSVMCNIKQGYLVKGNRYLKFSVNFNEYIGKLDEKMNMVSMDNLVEWNRKITDAEYSMFKAYLKKKRVELLTKDFFKENFDREEDWDFYESVLPTIFKYDIYKGEENES